MHRSHIKDLLPPWMALWLGHRVQQLWIFRWCDHQLWKALYDPASPSLNRTSSPANNIEISSRWIFWGAQRKISSLLSDSLHASLTDSRNHTNTQQCRHVYDGENRHRWVWRHCWRYRFLQEAPDWEKRLNLPISMLLRTRVLPHDPVYQTRDNKRIWRQTTSLLHRALHWQDEWAL